LLYYDLDCNGNGFAARWILDSSTPDPQRSYDLDDDGSCSYNAQFTSASTQPPLGTRTWRVNYGGWTNIDLMLTEVLVPPPASPSAYFSTLVLAGVQGTCSSLASLDGTFFLGGVGRNGAPYYVQADSTSSLYFDPDCNGDGVFSSDSSMWVLDAGVPNATTNSDLDGDGRYAFFGRCSAQINSLLSENMLGFYTAEEAILRCSSC
jgi:hypothetical protein